MRIVFKLFKMIIGIIATFIGVMVLITVLFINFSSEFGAKPSGDSLTKIEASKNYSDGKFQNETDAEVIGKVNLTKTLRGYFNNKNTTPDWSIPVEKIIPENILATQDTITKVSWFGHSALLLEMDGKKIFLDPMLGNVPAPHPWLAPGRFNDTLPIGIEELPALDAVVISHDHYDHLDYGSITQLKDKVGHFYVPLGVGAHLVSWGVAESIITELDWWESVSFEGITLTATPAQHFSGRGMTDRFRTQWCSWVIEGEKDKIYFSGDSGYAPHFKEIGEKFGPFDLAIMECGQYNEQWAAIHMMPEETVQATLDLRSDVMIPIHWGAFKLSLHSWIDPIERVKKAATAANVRLATPKIGEAVILGAPAPTSVWWEN